MNIVLDAMGGDKAPKAIIDGAILALNNYSDLNIILTGQKDKILPFLSEKYQDRIQVYDCLDVIENEDSPTEAIKLKPDSSLIRGFDLLKQNKADAFISAGSTGAILAGGFTKIGRIKGISRPALSPILPTLKDSGVMLIDVGANVDTKPVNLLHFALMGTHFMKTFFSIESPKVALLNIGTEKNKGNQLTKEVYELLENNKQINFCGNIEARDILNGEYDVVVADGFVGNVALKAMEGAVGLTLKQLKIVFGGLSGKIAGLLLMKKLKKLKTKLDYNKYGGTVLLGCKKIIIKAHGSSDSTAVFVSIKQAINLIENDFINKITDGLKLETGENYD